MNMLIEKIRKIFDDQADQQLEDYLRQQAPQMAPETLEEIIRRPLLRVRKPRYLRAQKSMEIKCFEVKTLVFDKYTWLN
jgi:hypothetical protein